MRRIAVRARAWRTDGGLARLVTWAFVLLLGLNATSDASTPLAVITPLAGIATFLWWEMRQQKLPPITSTVLSVALITAGLLAHSYFTFWLGLPILMVSLGLGAGLALAVLALGLFAWVWPTATEESLPVLLLGVALNVLLVYLFQRIALTARRLRAARADLASTHIEAERNRLAAELNTLIGDTLEQASIQAKATRVGLADEEEVAHARLADVEALVARGLSQLRQLAFEPIIDDVETEVRTAQTLCRRLGVAFVPSIDRVDATIDTTFALLLRESVTNMFKHAEPTRCTLMVRQDGDVALFSFTNDGATSTSGAASGGTGQRRWRSAVEGLGGTLEAGPLSAGRYRVLAQVPVPSSGPTSPGAVTVPQGSHGD